MHINLLQIYEGWTKSLGFVAVSDAEREEAKRRVLVCVNCPFAEENWLSKVKNNILQRDEIGSGIGCSKCGCPVNEISFVNSKKCPEGRW